jgi:hypothetical protein
MFSTLSQGFSDCKNYSEELRYYSQPIPQLLSYYHFIGAFTGGMPNGEMQENVEL